MTKENMSNKEIDDFIARLEAQKQPEQEENDKSDAQEFAELYGSTVEEFKDLLFKSAETITKTGAHKPSILNQLFPDMTKKQKLRVQSYVDAVEIVHKAIGMAEKDIEKYGSVEAAVRAKLGEQ